STVPQETATALRTLIDCWRACDVDKLKHIYETSTLEGLPAVVAFVLGTLGDKDNLKDLAAWILDPKAASDTQWAIADSLLLFNPIQVTDEALAKMRETPALHMQAAYMIGKLRVATRDSEEAKFLVSCLASSNVKTRGLALKSLAELGIEDYRELCD